MYVGKRPGLSDAVIITKPVPFELRIEIVGPHTNVVSTKHRELKLFMLNF